MMVLHDRKKKEFVPWARYFRNPVPNVVRCGVWTWHLAHCVLEARYRGVDSGVPLARYAGRRHPHPAQQSCTELLGERAFSTRQSYSIRILKSSHN